MGVGYVGTNAKTKTEHPYKKKVENSSEAKNGFPPALQQALNQCGRNLL